MGNETTEPYFAVDVMSFGSLLTAALWWTYQEAWDWAVTNGYTPAWDTLAPVDYEP